MSEALRFRYATASDAETYPPWSKALPRFVPCSYEWTPGMWDSIRQDGLGRILSGADYIPWEWNIQEVRVQSRKAYEILCRVERPPVRNPLVMIDPPAFTVDHEDGTHPARLSDGVLIVAANADAGTLAIMAGFNATLTIGNTCVNHLSHALVAVFTAETRQRLDPLAYAVACGCRVVSSDANAAEEYLAQHAKPGTWHIVHTNKATDYREAIKALLGQADCFLQSEHKDNSPWMPLTS